MRTVVLRLLVLPIRFRMALSFCGDNLAKIIRWLFASNEHTNITYHLTDLNTRYLAYFLSTVCEQTVETMEDYLDEILNDV